MEIYNRRGPKHTWHQNEARVNESKRNAPTREQMRLLASNIKEIQQERIGALDMDYCQALYHELLARVIAQALPVFDIKFAFAYLHLQP